MSKVVVLGGGAAGFFAAIHAAEQGGEVTILEKSSKLLSKVKVSGGGRCNVTNVIGEPPLLVLNYPRGSKELLGPFTRFGSVETREWFEMRGVQLKAEPDGRVFPVSDNSQSIIDCLMQSAAGVGVKILLNTRIDTVTPLISGFELSDGNSVWHTDSVIIASGGHSNQESYNWLSKLGHHIIKPVPSLFTFNIPESRFKDLMGLSVEWVRIKLEGTRLFSEGPLLFTHWGLSGPAVLRLSAFTARELSELNYDFQISVNFFPHRNEEEFRHELAIHASENKLKKIYNSKYGDIPTRLWERLAEMSGITSAMNWSDAGKNKINTMIKHLSELTFHVSGKTTFKEEFVTCGGVDLRDVNMQTMESKKVPGIYFAGEVLNIDGITGGFNFQAAWTTGFIAGISAAQKKSR
jgi:predicted Rossmann fold flavoprotein